MSLQYPSLTETFEMAVPPGVYEVHPCSIFGSFAIHKWKTGEWRISHAATGFGIPSLYPKTKRDAIDAALILERAADWSKITRTDQPGSPHMGLPKEVFASAVRAVHDAVNAKADAYVSTLSRPRLDGGRGMSEWIDWYGGRRPVPAKTIVEIKTRRNLELAPDRADVWRWGWTAKDRGHDIIAYRIVEEEA